MTAPTLTRSFPVHHLSYLTDRPYRRLCHTTMRRAIEAGVRFEMDWEHTGDCCTRQPQAVTLGNLIDQLNLDGVVIWKVEV